MKLVRINPAFIWDLAVANISRHKNLPCSWLDLVCSQAGVKLYNIVVATILFSTRTF